MPRIPTVEPQKTLRIANQPNIPMGFGTAPGRAIQGLGSAIGGLSGALGGEGKPDPEVEHQNQLNFMKWSNEVELSQNKAETNYNVDKDRPEIWQQQRNEETERRLAELDATWQPSNEASRRKKEILMEQFRGNYQLRNQKFAGTQREVKIINDTQGVIATGWTKVNPDENFATNFAAAQELSDRLIDNTPTSNAKKQQMRVQSAQAALATVERLPGPQQLPFLKQLQERILKGQEAAEQAPVPKRSAYQGPILDKAPTSSERRAIQAKGGIVVNLDTNWAKGDRQTTPMVVIPDNATPAQRQAAEEYAASISREYQEKFGKSLKPRVVTRSQNGRGRAATIHTEPFAVTDSQAVQYFSSPEGRARHAQILRDTLGKIPGVQFAVPHMPRKGDLGAHGSGTNEVELARSLLNELHEPGAAASSGPSIKPSVGRVMVEAITKMMPDLEKRHGKFIEEQRQMQRVGQMVQGNIPFNKFDTDEKKLVNNWAERTQLGQRLMNGDISALPAIVQATKTLNHVPDAWGSVLRTMAAGKDPKQSAMAYEAGGSILASNPRALDGMSDFQNDVEAYTALTTSAGRLGPEEAVARIAETKTQEWKTKTEVRKKAARELSEPYDASKVLGQIDQDWFKGEMNPRTKDIIAHEYREKFEEHYIRYGDEKAAEAMAANDMRKVYGISKATGAARVMRFPPEMSYPSIGKDGHKYLQDDLKETVTAKVHEHLKRGAVDPSQVPVPEIDMDDVTLIPTPRSAEEIAAREPPKYQVVYNDPDQNVIVAFPQRWGFSKDDLAKLQKKEEENFKRRQAEALKRVEERETVEIKSARDKNAARIRQSEEINQQAIREKEARQGERNNTIPRPSPAVRPSGSAHPWNQ